MVNNAKASAFFMYELGRLTISKIRNYIHEAMVSAKKKAFSKEGFTIKESMISLQSIF